MGIIKSMFGRVRHPVYTEQRLFGVRFRFLRKDGYRLLDELPGLLEDVKYRLSDPAARSRYALPRIMDGAATIRRLAESGRSLARYGDGEFTVAQGGGIRFQRADARLRERLIDILRNTNPNLLVCIPDQFGASANEWWTRYVARNRPWLYAHLTLDSEYGDSLVSRPYECDLANLDFAQGIFTSLRRLWDKRNVVFVEGRESRLGYGNDLFANALSIRRILCPTTDAFAAYDRILATCFEQPEDSLFVLALGPTATVLADDLSKAGRRALDLGHVDIQYEWMRMGATKRVPVAHKYVNEVRAGRKVAPLDDEVYRSQIVVSL